MPQRHFGEMGQVKRIKSLSPRLLAGVGKETSHAQHAVSFIHTPHRRPDASHIGRAGPGPAPRSGARLEGFGPDHAAGGRAGPISWRPRMGRRSGMGRATRLGARSRPGLGPRPAPWLGASPRLGTRPWMGTWTGPRMGARLGAASGLERWLGLCARLGSGLGLGTRLGIWTRLRHRSHHRISRERTAAPTGLWQLGGLLLGALQVLQPAHRHVSRL